MMKKLYRLCFVLFLVLPVLTGFSQDYMLKSELCPDRGTNDSRFTVTATVMDTDTWCRVSWPDPMTYYWELLYDDGSFEDLVLWQFPGSMNAVRFTPIGYPFIVTGGRINVGDGSFPGPFLGTSFRVLVYDDDGEDGLPGSVLDSMEVIVNNYEWVEFEGMTANITEGNFYLAMKQTAPALDAAPLGVDTDNPTYFKSYSYFQGNPGWMLSVYQDFMIRAWVVGYNEPSRNIDYFQLARFSNFNPDDSPLLGDTTFLDTTYFSEYDDYNWDGLPAGLYAYGVKTHFTGGEWSDYDVSNVVGHLNSFTVVISVFLCDTTWWEYTVLTVNGVVYPIDMEGGSGSVTIEFFSPIHCEIIVYAPGNDYSTENIYIDHDVDINIPLSCIHFLPRNLFVDPVSLHAAWDPPQVVGLDQDFEDNTFPPAGWQALSEGNGWFRTSDGSSAGWNIPGWYSHYACTNDLLPGNGNNGSMDYLITPPVDLRYRFDNFLSFYSYFDGNNGQEAFIEYSFDRSSWDTLYQLEPSTSWEYIELDLNAFSGPESDRIWFAFHADDNGQNASGWAIDSVRVFSPEPPCTLDGYWVFLYDSLIAITDTNFLDLPALAYGQEYNLCVKAHYLSGLSYPSVCTTFTSYYLYPPSCFYQDTIDQPLIICPPMDSTGATPAGFLGYNLYRDGDFVDFLPPTTTFLQPEEPGIYEFGLTAIYDLAPYGYPGETGETMELLAIYIMRWGYPLDFLETWALGNFNDNNWTTDGPNWTVNGQVGNPSPAAEFTWDPIQNDYSINLESYPLLADSMTEGEIYMDFDIKLSSVVPTGTELLLVQVWNWDDGVWTTAKTYSNQEGSFDWVSEHLDITSLAMNEVFKIRFSAQGDSSINILSWFIDNIHVYRECNPPLNLDVGWLQYNSIMELSWDKPLGTGLDEQWIHWDDGVNYDAIGPNAAIEFEVAARWEPGQLEEFEGGSVTQIAFYPYEEAATYRVRVWTGVSGSGPANMVADQDVPSPVIDSWNTVTLTTPVAIDVTQDLWVGYYINTTTGWPAGCDNGPAIDGYGNMINWNGWQTLLELAPTLDYNWNIEAYIQSEMEKSSGSRELVRYVVYRSDNGHPFFIRDYAEQEYFLDDSICGGVWMHCYYVTALYMSDSDSCESAPSNEDCEICEGINEETTEFNLTLVPNPCNDFLRIESSEELGMVSVYNSFGELMLKKMVDDRQVEIPVKDYPAGVYMIRVETENEFISRKVIVMH